MARRVLSGAHFAKSKDPSEASPWRRGDKIVMVAQKQRIFHETASPRTLAMTEAKEFGMKLDVLLLYKGGECTIQEVISAYGSPTLDSYVMNIRDDHLDNLPRDLHECSSIERVSATGGDIFDNWCEISGSSPGEAPY